MDRSHKRKSKLRNLAAAAIMITAMPANGCDLALAFAIDVSGSVDPHEYNIQVRGLADGLRDGAVSEALAKSKASLMLVQWTGSSRQIVSLPWTQVPTFASVQSFADQVENSERPWRNYSTAIGEALMFTAEAFRAAPTCKRRVIDVSGDGVSNEGIEPTSMRQFLRNADITVNALAIEGNADDLTAYFWENVIVGEGAFVVTADGFAEYAEKIRLKLRRETTRQISQQGEKRSHSVQMATAIDPWFDPN